MSGLKRVRYSTGILLSEKDFNDEQSYFLEKQRRHNRALHGAGVVVGLEVRTVGYGIRVEPGMALDANGNEIVVEQPVTLSLEERSDTPLYVMIRYAEIECELVPVVTPEVPPMVPSRIQESFELSVTRDAPKPGGGTGACPLLLAQLSYQRGRWRVTRSMRAPHVRS